MNASMNTSMNMNRNQPYPKFKLSHLPLRPSTLSVLTRRGFNSTEDVQSSKSSQGGGISNFASELEIPLADAVGISREVESAIRSMLPTTATTTTSAIETCGNKRPLHEFGSGGANVRSRVGSTRVGTGTGTGMQYHRRAPQTAAAILSSHYKEPILSRPIISFVKSIDSLLGGGFHPKEVTEVSGLPGVGKTQLAMQLCVDACLPKTFGGTGGESIYIDSEGSFSPERCLDMANAIVDHVHNSAARRSKNMNGNGNGNQNGLRQKVVPQNFTPDCILDSIHVFRVYDETCQSATILSLPKFIKKMKEQGRIVKVLVIDSIAFHYRCSNSDYKSRTKSLTSTAAFLSDLANTFDLSVLVINQMTTKIAWDNNRSNGGGGGSENTTIRGNNDMTSTSSIVPALGESWAHSTTTRILLTFDNTITMNNSDGHHNNGTSSTHGQGQRRICKLVKSSHKASGIAYFSVTEFGLRDCIQ